jgi:Transcriptional regulator PadR-like family
MKKTKPNGRILTVDRDLYSGMMCLHVLHHATERPIFGLGIVEELARYGYRISPGTLYPLLYGWREEVVSKLDRAAEWQVAA